MPSRHPYFFVSARGRLLSFNLLMVAVTLMVAGVAIFGFRHASQLQEQVQLQTLSDMNGSMNLARDTANVATAAVRLSQVVGALEYKSEAQRLLETQQALKHSLGQLASAPLARQELALVASIIRRSNELQQSVAGMLERGQRRHLQRNELLSALYQNQSYLRHLQDLNDRDGKPAIDPQRLNEMDRLIVAAIHTATPRSIVLQLDDIRRFLPRNDSDSALAFILPDFNAELARLAHGEQNVTVPALQRRDELGELARAFNVFARNTASLEHTTRLLREKTTQMEIDRLERQGLEEALLHSQKMKAVGQLTGGLAHDFNNLLAVIIGSLELVQPDERDAPRISRALKAAERGALLTQRLLAFSRKQALNPQAVVLQPLLENVCELMRHSLPASLRLEIEAQSPAWPAWIDVGQLENAIINLVMNARDAMEGRSGVIALRTWNQRVTRSDGRRQDMVALEVIDHGCGMSQEIKAQVFEPFFTTKQTGSGSGLGLSMVYGFVRQSGGRVAIESAPGQGTTVRLQLPRATAAAEDERTPLVSEPMVSGERLALVLEDEADVRQTLCEQLHQLGWMTLEAQSGEQALQMLAASGDIALLISDLMLPGGLSGAEVIHEAQRRFPAVALLLISGQDLRPAHNPALPEVERLRKPFTRTQLAQALRAAMARI
ncbi:ATP-binding protein [Klebsiella aerogenes]|uniref:ATP-binding protein n=1 Tax=Klebsiella aerogenes TaxID=548 RepID=UPI002DB875D0|nr:ATP-binding protein [Klebsiella aerogenes]MEB6385895.1 ATP-binding protein [Klebsiella aerogenes]